MTTFSFLIVRILLPTSDWLKCCCGKVSVVFELCSSFSLFCLHFMSLTYSKSHAMLSTVCGSCCCCRRHLIGRVVHSCCYCSCCISSCHCWIWARVPCTVGMSCSFARSLARSHADSNPHEENEARILWVGSGLNICSHPYNAAAAAYVQCLLTSTLQWYYVLRGSIITTTRPVEQMHGCSVEWGCII